MATVADDQPVMDVLNNDGWVHCPQQPNCNSVRLDRTEGNYEAGARETRMYFDCPSHGEFLISIVTCPGGTVMTYA